jgi:hypothetical protein
VPERTENSTLGLAYTFINAVFVIVLVPEAFLTVNLILYAPGVR